MAKLEIGARHPSEPADWFGSALLHDAANRLTWVAVIVGIVFPFHAAITLWRYGFDPTAGRAVVLQLTAAALMLLGSIVVIVLARLVPIDDDKVYWFALAYLLPVAFAAGIVRHAEPWLGNPRGWAGISVAIAVFPVLVPCPPRRALGAGLLLGIASAAAYGFTLLLGNPPVSPIDLPILFRGEALAMIVAGFVAVVVYGLGREAEEALRMGPYDLIERLGTGGMGEVWRGHHALLARPAAVKIIRPDTLERSHPLDREAVVERFQREVQATAALTCPHTVVIYDYGVSRDGTLYYVMELLDGIDLYDFVTRYGVMSPARVVHVLRQACLSLAEAHLAGLVHRDIKPSNLFLCRYGTDRDWVKVLDFGLVGLRYGSAEDLRTPGGEPLGTAGYMAPEQLAQARSVDGRADLYALGAVAYWLLTGRHAFDGDGREAILRAQVETEPVPIAEQVTWPVPKALVDIVTACLRRDPMERPTSAEQIHDRLTALEIERPWSRRRAADWWAEHEEETG